MNRVNYTCVRCGQEIDRDGHASGLCQQCRDQAPVRQTQAGESTSRPIGLRSDPDYNAIREKACPSCGHKVAENVVVCVQCGYDWRSGKTFSSAGAGEPGRWQRRIRRMLRLFFILTALVLASLGTLKLWRHFDLGKKTALPETRSDELVPIVDLLAQTRSAHNRVLLGDFAGGCDALLEIAAKHPEIYSARRVPELLKLHGLVPGFDGTSFRGTALDLIVLFCGRTGCDVSIDPEAVADLAGMEVVSKDFGNLHNTEQLALLLEPLGVTFKSVPVLAGLRTQLITTHALWAYSEALWALDKNDTARARAVLDGVEPIATLMGRHVEGFRHFLTAWIHESTELDSLELQTDRAINPILILGKAEVDANPGLRSEAKSAAARVALFFGQDMTAQNYFERIEQAMNGGFVREALWTMAQYERRLERFRETEERLLKAGVEPGFHVDETVAQERKSLEQVLRSRLVMTEKFVVDAEKRLVLDVDGALSDYTMARSLDRFDIKARIGCGRFIPKSHLDAASELQKHASDQLDEKAGERLARSLREEGRFSMAELLETDGGQSFSDKPSGAIGFASGLSAAETDAVFAVEVRILPLSGVKAKRALVHAKSNLQWQWLKGDGNTPVFLESGLDDPVAIMSGSIVLAWLTTEAAGRLDDQTISVGFRTIMPGVGNDSLGAAMALAGWSRVHECPLVRGVAITGSLGQDGALLAAVSIADKIRAAHRRHAAELVLVPESNALDLDALPLDQLLRTVLITTGNMNHVLRYAVADATLMPKNEAVYP